MMPFLRFFVSILKEILFRDILKNYPDKPTGDVATPSVRYSTALFMMGKPELATDLRGLMLNPKCLKMRRNEQERKKRFEEIHAELDRLEVSGFLHMSQFAHGKHLDTSSLVEGRI